jgi:hypothetical protein
VPIPGHSLLHRRWLAKAKAESDAHPLPTFRPSASARCPAIASPPESRSSFSRFPVAPATGVSVLRLRASHRPGPGPGPGPGGSRWLGAGAAGTVDARQCVERGGGVPYGHAHANAAHALARFWPLAALPTPISRRTGEDRGGGGGPPNPRLVVHPMARAALCGLRSGGNASGGQRSHCNALCRLGVLYGRCEYESPGTEGLDATGEAHWRCPPLQQRSIRFSQRHARIRYHSNRAVSNDTGQELYELGVCRVPTARGLALGASRFLRRMGQQ